jgi:drug/metabolite transporter (DMT)-like permease
MVAMKGVIPRTGPFFVAALRLLPAGALLVAFAAARGRKQPSGWEAWLAIAAFGLIDAACFQVHTRRHVDSSRRELLAPVPPRVCLWFLESKARCLFLVAFTGLPRGGIAEDVGWARERKAKSKLPRCSLAHQARQAIALSSWPGELVALTQFNSPFQVIIDSQPLTVAILASLLFGESIGAIGVGGLVLGVVGLLLLEVCLLLMRVQT